MIYSLKYWKMMVGTFVLLAFLWVTILTVDDYFGRPDRTFLVLLFSVGPLIVIGLADRKTTLKISTIDILAFAWFSYSILNALFLSENHSKDALIPLTTTFVLYAILRLVLPQERSLDKILVAWIVVFGLYECVVGLLQLYGFERSNHAVFRITGTFFNPGPYSIYVATMLAICLAYCHKRYRIYSLRNHIGEKCCVRLAGSMLVLLCTAGGIVGLITIPATLSRTAFVALAVVLLILFGRRNPRLLLAVMVLALAFGAGLYFLKKDSADGRLLMWIVSLRAICGHPVFGSGIGGFHKAFSDSQKEYFMANPDSSFASVAGAPEYAFNDFLEVGVEQGLVGLLLFSLIIIVSICKLLRGKNEIGYGLLALSVCAMFSYPFSLLPFRVLGCLFVARAAAWDKRPLIIIAGWHKAVVSIMSCMICVSLLIPINIRIRDKVNAVKDFAIDKILRIKTVNDLHLERAKILCDHPKYLFWLGKRLKNSGRYEESLDAFRRGTEVSCDNMFYVMMGNVCASLNRFDEAEDHYKVAHYMQPCKLYPLYQLLLLYESEGRLEDANRLARAILDSNPKVRSSATDEMKTYASEFLSGGVK
jgi:O-antigen ligase